MDVDLGGEVLTPGIPHTTHTVVGFDNQQMTQGRFSFDLIRRGLQPALKSAYSQFAVHTIHYQGDSLCMWLTFVWAILS